MTASGATSDDPVDTPRPAGTSRAAGASALWRDMAGGTAADPGFVWALAVGIVLVALGLLGFVPNPVVGSPSAAWGVPLLLTGDAHDVLHLVGGAVALHAALGMSRAHRDTLLIGLGAAALILLALGLLDGRWFGIAPYHVGLSDQLLHLIIGVGSLVMGLAGTGTISVPVVTGAYRRSELGISGASAAAVPLAPGPQPADEHEPPADSGPPAVPESLEILPEPLGLDLDEPDAEPEALGLDLDEPPAAERPSEPGPETAEAAPSTVDDAATAAADVVPGPEPMLEDDPETPRP